MIKIKAYFFLWTMKTINCMKLDYHIMKKEKKV